MTQNEMILEYLKEHKTMTKLQGLRELGIMNVGARIGELRQLGYEIETEMIQVKGKKKVARYLLNG